MLLYGDESEALTHPYLARAWAKRGADLRVPAPGQAKKVAMLGSLDHVTRRLIVHTSRTKRSSDFIAHLEQLDRLYGPKPGRVTEPVVLVEDNGPIHTSKASLAALEARKHWLTVEWLPKYAPELNDIEVVWHDLKAHHLAHQTFTDAEDLDREIHAAVNALNKSESLNRWSAANLCLVMLLLAIKSRRYRFFDVYRGRVRRLERHYCASIFSPLPDAHDDWMRGLADDLRRPVVSISFTQAMSRRLRRNYCWMFFILLAAWLLKTTSAKLQRGGGNVEFVHSGSEWLDDAALGPLPGWFVIMLVGTFYMWVTYATFRHAQRKGELAHGDVYV